MSGILAVSADMKRPPWSDLELGKLHYGGLRAIALAEEIYPPVVMLLSHDSGGNPVVASVSLRKLVAAVRYFAATPDGARALEDLGSWVDW